MWLYTQQAADNLTKGGLSRRQHPGDAHGKGEGSCKTFPGRAQKNFWGRVYVLL